MKSPFGIWLVAIVCGLALQQPLARADNEEEEDMPEKRSACFEVCGDYIRWGYDCATLAHCFEKQATDEAAFVSCYQACTHGGAVCQEMCINHYDSLTESCEDQCEEASIVDIFCEDRCLKNDFKAQFGSSLPDLTSQDVGVWEGVPYLDKSAEDDVEEPED